MNRNCIRSLISAACLLPIAGVSENMSQMCIGKKSSNKINIPNAPCFAYLFMNNDKPSKISIAPEI